jgi:hypothetical protein
MSKLAWYVVIMLAIDILLYIARFGVAIIKSAKQDASPSDDSTPQDTDTTSSSVDGSVQPPSA